MIFRLRTALLCLAAVSGLFLTPLQAQTGIRDLSFRLLPAAADDDASSLESAAAGTTPTVVSSKPASTLLRTQEADERLRRADEQLAQGKRFYENGDLLAARRAFDAAVDILLKTPQNLSDRQRVERRLEEMADTIYRLDVDKLGAGETFEAAAFDKAPIEEISQMTFPVDPKLMPKVQSELKGTSSGIPLELSGPVLSYIHFFSSERGRRTLLTGFRRAGRYKQMIQRILTEEGVPQELIYLAQAESGFLPRAVSYKSAVGMWQFIFWTGQRYDLNRDKYVDDRLDPEKATRAAARHLKDLYARYGDWYLAMAAYNCGPGNVDRAIERTGYADYWELLKRGVLPRETSNYVPIIVAMTIMAKNPQDYGLAGIEEEQNLEYESIKMDTPVHLALLADAAEQPVNVIRDLNPALLRSVAPTGYELRVPKGTSDSVVAAVKTVPAAYRASWRLHRVESGETLVGIAQHYQTSANRILAANDSADAPEAGELLLIPATFRESNRSSKASSSSRKARLRYNPSKKHARKTYISSRSKKKNSPAHTASKRVLHRRATVQTASAR